MHLAALAREELEAGAGQLEFRLHRRVWVGAVRHANDATLVNPLEIALDPYYQIFLYPTFKSSRDVRGDVTINTTMGTARVRVEPILFRAGTEGIAPGVELPDYLHIRTALFLRFLSQTLGDITWREDALADELELPLVLGSFLLRHDNQKKSVSSPLNFLSKGAPR